MDVLTGADNQVFINKNVFDKICNSLGRFNYETGGVLGMVNDTVVEFEFDTYSSHELYEYYPTTELFENIINDVWISADISFCGIVHSHLHNNKLSAQDISYCQEIIKANSAFDELIIGILDLSCKWQPLSWYSVNLISANKINIICV